MTLGPRSTRKSGRVSNVLSVLVERLVGIGYEYVPEFERVLPFRRYFRKMREGRRTHQIHLVERSTDFCGGF
jgi:hypothetical protein